MDAVALTIDRSTLPPFYRLYRQDTFFFLLENTRPLIPI